VIVLQLIYYLDKMDQFIHNKLKMPQSKQEIQSYQEDEFDPRALFNSLLAKRFLIAGLTSFLTILAILYAFNLTPTYKATSSFTSPSSISIININKLNITTETKDSVFSKFLTQLSSKDLQKQVFIEGDFLTIFNLDKKPIGDIDEFFNKITKSLKVNSPNLSENNQNFGPEKPFSVSMEGSNAKAISEYLNSLVILANSQTMKALAALIQLKISKRLEDLTIELRLLLDQAENDRLSQIERIKQEDVKKIRELNGKIDRARYKEKETRLSQIIILNEAAQLAKSLGIIENNFKLINSNKATDLTIAIGESKDLPDWYLYGESALLEKIKILNARTNDDPYIPELVTLNNELTAVKNNNILKALEERKNDSHFIKMTQTDNEGNTNIVYPVSELSAEKNKLESLIVDMNGFNSMYLSQISTPPQHPIKPNKKIIVLLAFFGSLMMSIFLALILGILKPDGKTRA